MFSFDTNNFFLVILFRIQWRKGGGFWAHFHFLSIDRRFHSWNQVFLEIFSLFKGCEEILILIRQGFNLEILVQLTEPTYDRLSTFHHCLLISVSLNFRIRRSEQEFQTYSAKKLIMSINLLVPNKIFVGILTN